MLTFKFNILGWKESRTVVSFGQLPGWFKVMWVVCMLIGLATMGFLVWVIVMFMKHFGVI